MTKLLLCGIACALTSLLGGCGGKQQDGTNETANSQQGAQSPSAESQGDGSQGAGQQGGAQPDSGQQGTGATEQPGPTDPLDQLMAALDERRREADLIAVIPPNTEAILARVQQSGMKMHEIKQRRRNTRYYVNRMVPSMRYNPDGDFWVVFDTTEKSIRAGLNQGLLNTYVVDYDEQFGDFALIRVRNRFIERDAATSRQVGLKAQAASVSGTITNLQFTPDGKVMLLTQKHGRFTWHATDSETSGSVVEMPQATGKSKAGVYSRGEGGFTGMVLHPDFERSPRLYTQCNWRAPDGALSSRISEWTVDYSAEPMSLTVRDERIVLEVPQEKDTHMAGQLAFGPDGYLYIGIGDGHVGQVRLSGPNAKPRSPAGTHRGKILRIDVNGRDDGLEYAIPADNPYVGDARFPAETWAWGFRNPWRFSFLPDGRIIAGDIGEDRNEELTFVKKGAHHGWPYTEGAHQRNPWPFEGAPQPALFPYDRNLGMSVIAGFYYEGSVEALRGKYVFADFLSGRIMMFDVPEDDSVTLEQTAITELGRWRQLLTTFGRHPITKDLYLATHTGKVFKIVEASEADGDAESTQIYQFEPQSARDLFAGAFDPGTHPENLTAEQAELGRELYSDPRLSANGKTSCATCHDLSRFGQNGATVTGGRNVPSTFNAQNQFAQMWDYRVDTVEEATLAMLRDQHGLDDGSLVDTLKSIPEYAGKFASAFPGDDPVTTEHAVSALGAFVRRLQTPSRWDRFLDGDDEALDSEELRGVATFIAVGCTACHQYRALGGSMPQKLGLIQPVNGPDKGRSAVPGNDGLDYFFKVSPLRNVAETAPYYHDGSQETLQDAIRHMALVQLNKELTDDETKSIETFLKTLTGEKPAILR